LLSYPLGKGVKVALKKSLQKSCLKILLKDKAILINNHFVYTSGKHGSYYVNKDSLYLHPKDVSKLCHLIANHFHHKRIDIVVAPVIGGVSLSQWTAYHLSKLKGKEILAAYAEKKNDEFEFKRGYDKQIRNKSVLVIDDIMTTGGSVKKVIKAVKKAGGKIVGLAVLCNRGKVTPKQAGNPPELFSLVNLNLLSWSKKKCPLCQKGIPINKNYGRG